MTTANAAVLAVEDEHEIEGNLRGAPARAESRAAIESLLGELGYPQDWATDLERGAWDRGHVWKRVR